jgi:hypothetical protein
MKRRNIAQAPLEALRMLIEKIALFPGQNRGEIDTTLPGRQGPERGVRRNGCQ